MVLQNVLQLVKILGNIIHNVVDAAVPPQPAICEKMFECSKCHLNNVYLIQCEML